MQASLKALWRSFFQPDNAARHGMNWFTRRVLLHEWWNFFFGVRRIQNGPTLQEFWGESQEHQEIPLLIKRQDKAGKSTNKNDKQESSSMVESI